MTKYLESSCLQQISGVIKVGVLPRHHTSLVSTQQALRSPSQSVPTTSALHVHTRHACSFQNARKSNHSMKQKKKTQQSWQVFGDTGVFPPFILLLFFFCFYPPSPPGSSPFCAQPLAAALLPSPVHPSIPIHPHTSCGNQRCQQILSGRPWPAHPKAEGAIEIFPPGFPLSIAISKLAADKGAVLAPGIKRRPKSRGSRCSPNTTYCNPLLPPVLIQYRPSWVTRHFEDLTFSHYLSFT